MRRGSGLILVFGLLILVAAGAGIYLYLFAPGLVPGASVQTLEPTPRPDVEVVKAAIDIETGTLINDAESFLTIGPISGDEYAASPQSYFTRASDVLNLKSLTMIPGNSALRKEQLGPAGLSMRIPTPMPGQSPMRAFPIQVNNLTGVADLVQIGDRVDVMASFNMDVTTFRPGVPAAREDGTTQDVVVEQAVNEGSVKVLLQNVEVLDIVKAAPLQPTPEGQAAEAQPTPEAAPEPTPQAQQVAKNTSASVLQPGNWIMVIGVTQQEAETLRFALDRGIGISTLLRASGDHNEERTVGGTMRILIDNYGMPVPSGNPPVQQPGPVQMPGVPTLPQKDVETFAPAATPGSAR